MGIRGGIDIGSCTTKCVVADGEAVLARHILPTGVHAEEAAETAFSETLQSAGLRESDLEHVVSTGYGRRLFPASGRVVTEISAAGYGAFLACGRKECLVIDVGGQDTKVIEVDPSGEIVDFLMNDRCAAGTGRFLEMMCTVLQSDMEGFSTLALESRSPVVINSTCSVFAESEVISLISRAMRKEDIAAGLFMAIADRISAMTRHFPSNETVVFCGGGARSRALRTFLERSLERALLVPKEPQFLVAYGAALCPERGRQT